MDGKRNTPPHGARPGRHQTQTERDVSGLAAKAKRESQAIPVIVDEEVTGKYEGDELDAKRAARSVGERLKRLEDKDDEKEAKLAELGERIGKVEGELTHVPKLISLLEKSLEQSNATVSVTVNDQLAANKQRRELFSTVVLKIVAAGGALAGILYLLLQAAASKGCGG